MPSSEPVVSVIAVTRDEPVDRLVRMIDAVAGQDAPFPIEFVLAAPAGDHADVQRALVGWDHGPVQLLDNPSGSRTVGLNRCLDAASGRFTVRIDARAAIAPDHVTRCVARLAANPSVVVVGGHQCAAPTTGGSAAAGIARALRNPWLLGHAAYRDPLASGSVDTVYLGAFRTKDVRRFRYDEGLDANEDFELCRRIRTAGGTVWLEAGLDVRYEPRAGWRDLERQYESFGRAKVAFWRRSGTRPGRRQLTALAAAALGASFAAAAVRRPPVFAAGVATAATLALVTDELGSGTEPLAVRLSALPAHVAIESGWLLGIIRGLRERGPGGSGDVEHPLERDPGVNGGALVDDDPVHDLAAGE
jgi:succinoglycan biosynthesis protein ExoA